MYSRKVRELVGRLDKRGPLPEATHRGKAENPVCGDVVELLLRVEGDLIRECRFQASGCVAALASAAALAELCQGLSVQESLSRLDPSLLLDYLEGLPPHKHHGPEMAVQALRRALNVEA